MIVTITLNPAFDHLLFLHDMSLGEAVRAKSTQRTPGGKGINVASALAVMGEDIVATGFLGGLSSQYFEQPLRKIGVTTSFIYTDQELRTDFYMIEEKKNRQTLIIEEGDPVKLRYLNSFKTNLERILSSAEMIEIGGSLPRGVPPNFIHEIILSANQKNVKVALNLSGELLNECLNKVAAAIVKPDLEESESLFGEDLKSQKSRIKASQELQARGAQVVIFNFEETKYFVADKNEQWECEIALEEGGLMNGVQESVLAGFIYGQLRKGSLIEAMKYSMASALSTARNKLNYPNSMAEIEELSAKAALRKLA